MPYSEYFGEELSSTQFGSVRLLIIGPLARAVMAIGTVV